MREARRYKSSMLSKYFRKLLMSAVTLPIHNALILYYEIGVLVTL